MNNNNHWSKYWQSGAQTSLPNDFKNNYDGEIYDYWQHRVVDLKTGDKVLDVCTGNGAVALLLAEIAIEQGKNLQITAVDISVINTEFITKKYPPNILSQIQFIGQCPLANVKQYITQPQKLVVSQYGLEYTDLSETAGVLHKILLANGELAFIAHSADSDVFSYMIMELAIFEWLADLGIFQLLDSFSKHKLSANSFKNKLFTTVETNQPPIEFHGQALLMNWQKTITILLKSNNKSLKQQRTKIISYLEDNQAGWLRAKDMVAVGEKLADKNWTDAITHVGFKEIDKQTILYKNKHLAGYGYRYRKQ